MPGDAGRREAAGPASLVAGFSPSPGFVRLQIETPDSIIRSMSVATRVNRDTVMSTREAAKYLGLAENTVRLYLYRGTMTATKIGPVWCVTRSECDRYQREKRDVGRPAAV